MKLAVTTWGRPSAPPVVCIHGVTDTGRRAYGRFAEQALSADHYVIAPDLRGHGASGIDPPWNFRTLLADILETIDARTGTPATSCPTWTRLS